MTYSDAVWEHFTRPRNAGCWEAAHAGADVGTGRAVTPASDAVVQLQLRVRAGRVAAVRFQAYGCVSTIAAASWTSERVTGLSLDQALALHAADIEQALVLAPDRRHCALLAEDALRAALARFAPAAAEADNNVNS